MTVIQPEAGMYDIRSMTFAEEPPRSLKILTRAATALEEPCEQPVVIAAGVDAESAAWDIATDIWQLPTVRRRDQGIFDYIRELHRESRQPAYLCDDYGNIVGHTEGDPSFLVTFSALLLMAFAFTALAIMLPDGGVWAPLSVWDAS